MASYLTSPIITVAVGGEEAQLTFFLHQDLLVQSSGFFRSGLHEWFQSGKTRTIDLHEDDPTIFALFAEYIYSNKYGVEILGWEDVERDMDAYILGEKYLAPGFCQAVFHHLEKDLESRQENANKLLSVDKMLEYVQKIYAGTPTGDPLRQLLAKLAASMSGQPCELTTKPHKWRPIGYRQRMTGVSDSDSDSGSEEAGTEPAFVAGKQAVFNAEERMKLVQEGGGEFVCDMLGHCLAPRKDDPREPKEPESKQVKEWFEKVFGRLSSA